MIFRLIFIAFLFSANALATPNIVVSIKPIHSIVSNITQGVTSPALLLESNQSAHHTHLKPSQLSLLDRADLVVFIHPNFEAGLAKAFNNIDSDKKFIIDDENTTNHHSWLDTDNMQIFAKKLVEKLIQIDPINTKIYTRNIRKLNKDLEELKQNIKQRLLMHKNKPIAIFSNAFDYFIDSNNLTRSTLITDYHGERLSIFKTLKAKRIIKSTQTNCLLNTTEIPSKRIGTLTEGLNIKTASIDIIGFDIKQGKHHYFELMGNIANKVDQCLQ